MSIDGEANKPVVSEPGTTTNPTQGISQKNNVSADSSKTEEPMAPVKETPASPSILPKTSSDPETTVSSEEDKKAAPPAPKSKRGSFLPKGNDVNWVPKEADIVWTRFDKSRTQALAIIIRCPKSSEGHKYNHDVPSVYCDSDAPDRYLVAFINSEAHVYPPRHYLVKFSTTAAAEMKCIKAKVGSLSPWEKLKRKAVRDALDYLNGKHKFENSHNFRMCCTCCEDGSDEFWKIMQLERGTIHIEMRPQLERQKEKLRKAQEKKDKEAARKAAEREERKRRLEEKVNASSGEDSDESGADDSKESTSDTEDDDSEESDEVDDSELDDDEEEDDDEEDYSLHEGSSEARNEESGSEEDHRRRRTVKNPVKVKGKRGRPKKRSPDSELDEEDVKERRHHKKKRRVVSKSAKNQADQMSAGSADEGGEGDAAAEGEDKNSNKG